MVVPPYTIEYDVIGYPPSEAGASKNTNTVPVPNGAATTFCGGPGRPVAVSSAHAWHPLYTVDIRSVSIRLDAGLEKEPEGPPRVV
jgi:hypothetical protein